MSSLTLQLVPHRFNVHTGSRFVELDGSLSRWIVCGFGGSAGCVEVRHSFKWTMAWSTTGVTSEHGRDFDECCWGKEGSYCRVVAVGSNGGRL